MTPLLQSIRRAKRIVHMLRGRDFWQSAQTACDTCSLGNDGARRCVCPDGLGPSSIVYSFGVGEEISFDLELIRRFGACVHAFDPTPRSIEWLAKQSLPSNFLFHPYGIADFEGHARFVPPVNPAHVSHTLVDRQTPWPSIELPVRRLGSIMRELGHDRIDLLKMDIEGAEYSVLKDMLTSGVPVHQLLVEFHHRWPEIGIEKTRQAIRELNSAGYRIFEVAPNGEEYGFLRFSQLS